MKKYIIIASTALALGVLSHAAEAAPSAIPGQACDVNWIGGACGHGPLSEAGTGGFPQSPCNRHDPCDCNKEKPARS